MSAEIVARADEQGLGRLGRIVNNFVHDVCTGGWVACLIVVYTISRGIVGVSAEAASVLHLAETRVWLLLLATLVGVTVTGAIRLAYWRREAAPEDLATKRRALIWKHMAFVVVYGFGTVWAYLLLTGRA